MSVKKKQNFRWLQARKKIDNSINIKLISKVILLLFLNSQHSEDFTNLFLFFYDPKI